MRQENRPQLTRLNLLLSLGVSEYGMSYGEIQCDHLPSHVPFWGMGNMVGELDRICDYLDFPHSWETRRRLCTLPKDTDVRSQIRRHWDAKEDLTDEELDGCTNRFSIQIFCRQHSSIQGMLQIKNERVPFRSAMELMTLLGDALCLEQGYMTAKRKMLHVSLPLRA